VRFARLAGLTQGLSQRQPRFDEVGRARQRLAERDDGLFRPAKR
jgi:hypothetical protein